MKISEYYDLCIIQIEYVKKNKKKHNEYVKKISTQNFTAVRGDKGTPLF